MGGVLDEEALERGARGWAVDVRGDELHPRGHESRRDLPGAEAQRGRGDPHGARVDVDAVEVLLEDRRADRLGRGDQALFEVERVEEVEGLEQEMPASTRRIEEAQLGERATRARRRVGAVHPEGPARVDRRRGVIGDEARAEGALHQELHQVRAGVDARRRDHVGASHLGDLLHAHRLEEAVLLVAVPALIGPAERFATLKGLVGGARFALELLVPGEEREATRARVGRGLPGRRVRGRIEHREQGGIEASGREAAPRESAHGPGVGALAPELVAFIDRPLERAAELDREGGEEVLGARWHDQDAAEERGILAEFAGVAASSRAPPRARRSMPVT